MVLPLRDETPTVRTPVVTILLIVVNVLVFVALQPRDDIEFLYERAAVPCEIVEGAPVRLVPAAPATVRPVCPDDPIARGAPTAFPDKNLYLAVITSMFLHGGWLHLGGNMLFLWIFGNNVEDRLGRFGYALFYVACGVAAAALHVYGETDSAIPVIGASGAIAGVMGAYALWYPRHRILSVLLFFVLVPLRLPAWLVLGVWFVLQFFTQPETGVAWLAHVGGFIAGAVVALALARLRPEPDPWAGRGPAGGGYRPPSGPGPRF